jgi:hypothetical protein
MAPEGPVRLSHESLCGRRNTFHPPRQPAHCRLRQRCRIETYRRAIIPRALPQLTLREKRPHVTRDEGQLPIERSFPGSMVAECHLGLRQRRPRHVFRCRNAARRAQGLSGPRRIARPQRGQPFSYQSLRWSGCHRATVSANLRWINARPSSRGNKAETHFKERDPMHTGLAAWHRYMQTHDPALLAELIAPDAVFHSPVVHTPQEGRDKVLMYLTAAGHVFSDTGFIYVRELVDGPEALLEFTATVDGIHVNGIDLIRFDLEGKIIDFKVMVRPLKAMNKLWEMMAAKLEKA